jgi:Mitochondrial protein Pet127
VNLKRIATKHKSKYLMSTSTITAMLNHIYYAISNFKSPHFSGLSESYDHEPLKFMLSQRKPNTIFLRQLPTDNGSDLFSIDSDSGFTESSNEVLLKMGKYMEKMFTTDADYFNKHFVLDPTTNQPKPGA